MKTTVKKNQEVFAPPVSYAQERLWFLDQFEPSTALYNIPFVATVKGAINRSAFNRAVNRLIARHESLRTSFIKIDGMARQAILSELSVEVGFEDLSRVDARAYPAKLQAVVTETTSRPFDLTRAPLFRIVLAWSGRETTIITTIHHIISDGWSIGIFQRDLVALYEEELGGRRAALADLPIQYADYAVRQRERLEVEGLDRLRQYWRRQLEGATTILQLPIDYPRPLRQTFTGDVHMFDLDAGLTAGIRALTKRHDLTLFMAMLAAFNVLLYRLSAQNDILVGTPIAGRTSVELQDLIGLFVNTLVLRARLEPDQTFARTLSDVRQTTLEAFQHQDMPFEKLVSDLNPKRDLSHGPLVQVLFSLQNIPPLQALMSDGTGGEAATAPNLNGHTGTAKFDFALFVSEVGDKLQCSIEYNTDLFSAATIEEIAGCYTMLLAAVVSNPEERICSYPLMSESQMRRRLASCRGADSGYSEQLGCHHLLERQCLDNPAAIAVRHASAGPDGHWSYLELNQHANRIAHELAARGVSIGDRVAVCMSRSSGQIATVLGIVKAGAAYVPLDPDAPAERQSYILSNAKPRLLVCSPDIGGGMDQSVDLWVMERDPASIGQRTDNPGIPYSPDMPLYVIYTSGSTGRPKGVVMPHPAMVNLVEWQMRASETPRGGVTLQYAPLNFDVASQEIFSTLAAGGCLQLIDDPVRRDSRRLLHFLKDQHVSRLFLPPVALEELANETAGRQVDLASLREIIVAGDQLQVTDKVRRLFSELPGATLTNQYGPTESHVVSAHTLSGESAHWPTRPPIGKSIDNVQLYVLDDRLGLVPPKVTGELYIGGIAVAQGYLALPELTAERFVANPFQRGGRLYRTGDVCRYDQAGALEFVGRADQQIKLRGFRIEPAEIEGHLKALPGIRNAVVVKRSSKEGDERLVAYLIAEDGIKLASGELRGALGSKLPLYMIPAHFVQLDAFPLTGSGKIDRRRLPDVDANAVAVERESTYVAPRTPTEEFLADCWRSLLHVEKVSIVDGFFDLGGHSLSATQLVSRIRDEFNLELPLRIVFERPTIDLLAREILQQQAAQQDGAELETLLAEVESLSDQEIEILLAKAGVSSSQIDPRDLVATQYDSTLGA